ncbi:MAG: hypothetical protein ABIH74_04730 [Candidatus Omnitrophota bacterium]
MKNFIKKHWWKAALLVIAVYFAFLGWGIVKDLFFQAGMAAAKGEYENQIAYYDTRIAKKNMLLNYVSEKAARDRETMKAEHVAEISKHKRDVAYFKSETAEALKARKATEREWAAAKTNDEITINLQTEEIAALDLRVTNLIMVWKVSDEEKDRLHGIIVIDLEAKYKACQMWSGKLEKKLKPKFFGRVVQVVVIGAAFMLGRGSK